MSRHDWFRNEDWNAEIERQFYLKLGRARKKSQYVCLQAFHLSRSHPTIALRLLDKYFAMAERWKGEDARAFTFRADAHLALGDMERALEAYEDALAREKEDPGFRTEAWIQLPFLTATSRDRSRYDRALQLLQAPETMLFPVQRFKFHSAHALIAAELGQVSTARQHAREALWQAQQNHSGLRYHADLGLVGQHYEDVIAQLRVIAGDVQ